MSCSPRLLGLAGVLAASIAVSGCAHAPLNQPLAASGADCRYPLSGRASDDGLMVALFFSGGGTRASALSYGVLRGLAATPVEPGGRMLDRVTTINAVSGGSFTAAYYCLYGDRIFADFESQFLKRDVQGDLVRRCLTPANEFRLASSHFGRSDVAAEFYDETLFHGATFADLAKAGAARPYLVINTTNITTCTPLQFTQEHFDLIGSDLGSYPLSRAVAASSAVPLLFSPIILRNFADRVPAPESIVIEAAGNGELFASYRNVLADANRRYRDVARYPYFYLMDGGLSDNLSLRNLLNEVTLSGGWDAVLGRLRSRGVTRLAIIVVNAAVEGDQPWERLDEAPPLKSIVSAISNASINRANRETMAMVETSLALWQRERGAVRADGVRAPEVYLVRVEFRLSADPGDRAFFDTVPTRFHLPAETVDRVVRAGERLLAESPEFRRLLGDLAAERPGGTPIAGSP